MYECEGDKGMTKSRPRKPRDLWPWWSNRALLSIDGDGIVMLSKAYIEKGYAKIYIAWLTRYLASAEWKEKNE